MSSLSKNDHAIKPLRLKSIEDIDDNSIEKGEGFISLFPEEEANPSGGKISQGENPQRDIQTIDIEAEARKIFEDAYREGERAGLEMGMKKAEPVLKRLNADIAALQRFRQEMIERTERLSIELALVFAEAIILKGCEEDRETIIRMAKKAMEICEDKYDIKVRVRRDDMRYISEELIRSLNILPDDTLQEPGFIIETNFGDIDGSLSVQIDEMRKGFLSEYGDR